MVTLNVHVLWVARFIMKPGTEDLASHSNQANNPATVFLQRSIKFHSLSFISTSRPSTINQFPLQKHSQNEEAHQWTTTITTSHSLKSATPWFLDPPPWSQPPNAYTQGFKKSRKNCTVTFPHLSFPRDASWKGTSWSPIKLQANGSNKPDKWCGSRTRPWVPKLLIRSNLTWNTWWSVESREFWRIDWFHLRFELVLSIL